MIRVALILGLLISINNAFTHSPNEVSFSIYEKETLLLVDTEFPWSIRNAVFIYDTTLSHQSTLEEIHASLFNYVKENFTIKTPSGKIIQLLEVVNQKNQGHHENYQFVFENKEIGTLRNTLLFNFSKKQKNSHVLELNKERKEFVLTPQNPEIVLAEKSYYFEVILVFSGIILALLFFKIKRK